MAWFTLDFLRLDSIFLSVNIYDMIKKFVVSLKHPLCTNFPPNDFQNRKFNGYDFSMIKWTLKTHFYRAEMDPFYLSPHNWEWACFYWFFFSERKGKIWILYTHQSDYKWIRNCVSCTSSSVLFSLNMVFHVQPNLSSLSTLQVASTILSVRFRFLRLF